ncbi:hypothetical protein [Gimesia aquarii]|uniref:Secreted protein n=1 Tax=Gimesia aquarii TaxID=2527964 RepID=A0A517W4A5_9PLAN|nr:hypothetical protein [Gimesia aquarii]QDU00092.1 hypothetical protein V144x_56050 [Gimesia aquarii]
MRKQLHLTICCSMLCVLSMTGCQMAGGDGPITSTLGFRDVPKQSEPPVQSEEEIESEMAESITDE